MDNLTNTIISRGLEGLNRYYGIYRGVVEKPKKEVDLKGTNKLLVYVPDVLGGIRVWAYPRGQYGNTFSGCKYLTPREGDFVYITFEYGDPGKALWEPHGWAPNEAPYPLDDPFVAGIITPRGNKVIIREEGDSLQVSFNGPIIINSKDTVMISSSGTVTLEADDGIVLNQGDNDGLVNINQLTDKLNQLVSEIESLKTQVNTHTHTCAPPSSPSSPPITPINQTFSTFQKQDYEDIKILH